MTFGLFFGTLTGRVFFDSDGDNTERKGSSFEAGVKGVTVQLLDSRGKVVCTTTSDANGEYKFEVYAGDYKVKFVAPSDLTFVKNDVGPDGEDSDAGADGVTLGFARVNAGQTTSNVDAGLKSKFSIDAVNDHVTVTESEGSGDSDGNVLGNDTVSNVPTPKVTAVNGVAGAVGQFVDVVGGGKIKINADGTFDFSADGDFEDLNNGQSRVVTATYTITSTIAVSGGTNLLVNGDFECHDKLNRTSINNIGKWDVFDSIQGWRTPVGKLELQSGQSNGAPSNDKNNTVLELDSDDATDTNATVVQDVTIAKAGTYTFEFDYSPRKTGNEIASTSIAKILVDGVAIDTITSSSLGYKHFSYTVTLSAGAHTVGFQGAGTDDTVGALIDNVSLKQTATTITDTATVTITVTGETDNVAPVITTGNLSTPENQVAVATLAASDANGDAVTWSISGADSGLFNINAATGALSWKVAPNFENPLDAINHDNIYDVTAIANDGKGGVTSKALFVTVTNVNEAPVITSGTFVGVNENSTAVTTATAIDPDAGAVVTWSIAGADAALFTINAATGALAWKVAPDFETPLDALPNRDNVYNVDVIANDGLGGVASKTLFIVVNNVNEAPVITSAPTATVAENTTAVTTVTAVDPDAGAVVGFALSGADAALFQINAAGQLSFIAAPNFEAPTDQGGDNVYNVTVTASDGLGGSTSQNLAVTVTNVNEAPVITSAPTATVAENTTAVTTVTAVDPDAGAVVGFALSGADAALFQINAAGQLSFIAAPNFESPTDQGGDNVYNVTVTASDGLGGSTSQNLAVTVTNVNEAPVITSAPTATVAENTTAVTTVTAVDPDAGAVVGFALSGADAALFQINAAGQLSFIAAPNFESPTDQGGDNVYNVTVTASDGLGGSTSQNLAVTVTNVNEAPVITSAPTATVAENTTAVTTVTAVDPDAGAVVGFALSGADAALFQINAAGQLSFIAAPNFESPTDQGGDNVYNVTVTASDGLGGSTSQNLAVTVTNVNEAPVITSAPTATVAENTTAVTTVTAVDPDAGAVVGFALSGADAALFQINAAGQLSFIAAPNFESPTDQGGDNVYNVTVTASDGLGGSTSQNLAVTVTNVNEAPVITSAPTATVAENTTAVTTVTAVDPDAGAVVGFALSGADAALFQINAAGQLSFIAAPNFESPTDQGGDNVYNVTVTASDGLGGSTSQNLAVTVTNVNEAPVITSAPTATVAENTTAVTTVTAVDPDAGAVVGFALSGADAALFQINAAGQLSFIAAPNFESPTDQGGDNVYNVTVTASDGLGGSTSQNLAVTVTNVNEAPVITSAPTATVAENTTAVTTVTAVDPDAGAVVGFALSGADAALFQINAAGQLSFIAAPNFESPTDQGGDNVYDLIITASDGQGGSTTQALAVTVTNANDDPAITSGAAFAINENLTAVTTVTAVDEDNNPLGFSLIGGVDAAKFAIDATTGALSFLVAPDGDIPGDVGTNNIYDVIVQVSDGQGGFDTQAIAVTVNNIAETGARADSFATTDGVILNLGAAVGVLANDEVAAGGVLSVTSAGGAAPGTAIAGSNGGTFTIGSNGTVVFNPDDDFAPLSLGQTATTSVSYTITDGLGVTSTNTATVTVTGVNSAPVILESAFDNESDPFNPGAAAGLVVLEVGSGGPLNSGVLATITDVLLVGDVDQADTLHFSLSGEDASLFTVGVDDLPFDQFDFFNIEIPNGFTGYTTIRPALFLDIDSLSTDGDQLFEFTVTVTDNHGATDSVDYLITIT